MPLLVDTSVWSLALRRDQSSDRPELTRLMDALNSGEPVLATGLILQELLQGFRGAKARDAIIARFKAFAMIAPDRQDHIAAAELRNSCRRRGVQIGTIDALLGQLCLRHDLTLLTTDKDFSRIAESTRLNVWSDRRFN